MYIHIAREKAVYIGDIIAVLDLDNTVSTGIAQEFMRNAEQEGKIVNVAKDLPRAMVITEKEIYITSISAQAIQKRANDIKCAKVIDKE